MNFRINVVCSDDRNEWRTQGSAQVEIPQMDHLSELEIGRLIRLAINSAVLLHMAECESKAHLSEDTTSVQA